jgi:hypothetical protein
LWDETSIECSKRGGISQKSYVYEIVFKTLLQQSYFEVVILKKYCRERRPSLRSWIYLKKHKQMLVHTNAHKHTYTGDVCFLVALFAQMAYHLLSKSYEQLFIHQTISDCLQKTTLYTTIIGQLSIYNTFEHNRDKITWFVFTLQYIYKHDHVSLKQ